MIGVDRDPRGASWALDLLARCSWDLRSAADMNQANIHNIDSWVIAGMRHGIEKLCQKTGATAKMTVLVCFNDILR